MEKEFKPSFASTVFILGFLVVFMGISVLWLDIPIHVTITISAFVAIVVVMAQGFSWDDISKAIVYGGETAIQPVLILMLIGTVVGSWIASGTVPFIIYWGLKLISPSFFLVTANIICAITSLATGSSWSTIGTVGVALVAVGSGLGISPAMTAGAIVSGSYFGDKMSPLSDTTNLAPAVAEADLFDHIKSMFYTTTPGIVITLIIYAILGARYAGQSLDVSSINATLEALSSNFNLNIIVVLPAVLVIVLAIKQVPALATVIISALFASLLAIIFQGETITSVTQYMDTGFVSNIGIADIDVLLTRGGIQNMMWTSSLGLIGITYGCILEKANVLEVFLGRLKALTRTTGTLVLTTVLSLVGLNFATASQFLTIVLGGRMFVSAYKEKDLLPQVLSRTIEDAGTITSPLVPWGLCGVFITGTLGVPTLEYIPYAIFCWIVPVIAVIFGFTGLFQWKTGDIPSKKTYSMEDTSNS